MKAKRRTKKRLRKTILIEAATLQEMDYRLQEAELLGYSPASQINSTYDAHFQNHSILLTRKRGKR